MARGILTVRLIGRSLRPFAPTGKPRDLVALAVAVPLHLAAVSEFRFIQPCSPVTAKSVPDGDGWLHELKFDGDRVLARDCL